MLRDLGIIELSDQLRFRRPVLRDGPAHPCDIHVVLQGDVLVSDVTALCAAPHAGRHGHAVVEGTPLFGSRRGIEWRDADPLTPEPGIPKILARLFTKDMGVWRG